MWKYKTSEGGRGWSKYSHKKPINLGNCGKAARQPTSFQCLSLFGTHKTILFHTFFFLQSAKVYFLKAIAQIHYKQPRANSPASKGIKEHLFYGKSLFRSFFSSSSWCENLGTLNMHCVLELTKMLSLKNPILILLVVQHN